MRKHLVIVLVVLVALALGACRSTKAPATAQSHAWASTAPTSTPVPVRLPADDAPHNVLTEWWYYTGHLRTAAGERYGFEFVIFQSIRGQNPIGYLSHFAMTDPQRGRFRYDYRTAQRPSIPKALDLSVDGWTLQGNDGQVRLAAAQNDYAIELSLVPKKPAALHHGGLISFGAAGDSYYYSRTRLAISGRVRTEGAWRPVDGQAWFDHQWGNYVVPTVGGWDWFSVQLDNGSELMLSILRDEQGATSGAFGSFVDPAGRTVEVPPQAIVVTPEESWTSPRTGVVYPSGWSVHIPARPESGLPELNLQLNPLLRDQELAFDRMPYWEGAVDVTGHLDGQPAAGEGYVELTGYQPKS